MPRKLAALTSGTSARLDARALRLNLFAGKLPYSEKWRNVWGRDLDVDRIADAIAAARNGVMVYMTDIANETLLFDGHLGKLAQKRFGRTKIAPYTLQPRTVGLSREEKRVAKELCEMVQGKIERIRNFKQGIYDIAWGHFHARACLEVDWQWTGGRAPYTPVSLDWINPRRLGLGPDRELRLVEANTQVGWFEDFGFDFREIPAKFITYTPRRFADYPELEGLAPRSCYYSFFKRFAWRQRNLLTELFVLPWRTLEATDPAIPVQWEDMEEAVKIAEDMGDQTVAGFPHGISLKMLWPGSENQGQIMKASSDDVDSQMSRLWMLTDDTSKASGESGGGAGGDQAAYLQAQHDLVYQLDGVDISETLQEQLVDKIVELNAGADLVYLAPIFALACAPKKDRLTTQKVYSQAIADHVPVPLADYYRDTEIRPPDDDEAVLVMAPGEAGGLGEIQIVVPPGAKPPPGLLPPAPAAPLQEAPEAPMPLGDDDQADDEDAAAGGSEGAADALRMALGFERSGLQLARQPDVGHGSPEVIIERGLREGVRQTSAWAETLCGAVAGLSSETEIHRALERAAERLPVEPLAGSLERSMTRGVMTGALDAAWEAEDGQPVEIPTFGRSAADREEGVLFALGRPTPGFAATPFQDAIKFFLSKQVLLRREFDRLRASAKAKAFTIAGIQRKEILELAKDELGKQITAGGDLRAFDQALGDRFDSAGWTRITPSHVEVVFRNNVMGAYSVGRDRQMRQPAVLAARPYWQILGVDDARTRPNHRSAHGKVLRADDPAWSRLAPPLGHNCRCRKVSRSARDLERLKLTVTSGATLHGLPDKGWTGFSGF